MTIYDITPVVAEATNTIVAPLTEIIDNNHGIFEGHEIEIFELDGEILFNPYQVGECLEISDATVRDHMRKMNKNQVVKLTNSDVASTNIRKLNNAGENFLTESGLYKLLMKSRKPRAERFQDWVTDEVIPQIRKTGGYIPQNQNMSEAEIMAVAMQIANKTIEEQRKRIDIVEKEKENLSNVIAGVAPTVEFAEVILESNGTLTPTQIGADYGLSARELNNILYKQGIQYKSSGQWILYAKYKNRGYVDSRTVNIGNGNTTNQTVWTQKGRKFIHEVLKGLGIRAVSDAINKQIEMEV